MICQQRELARLSFFSEDKLVAAGTMWNVKGIQDKDQMKIISLWFNCTLNVVQILAIRRETRGAWIVLDDYMFHEGFMIPAIDKLNETQKNGLLKLYDRIKDYEFSSILLQLQNRDPIRQEIDRTFLHILGYSDKQITSLFEWMYDSVQKEITILKKLMGEGIGDNDLEEEKFIDSYV